MFILVVFMLASLPLILWLRLRRQLTRRLAALIVGVCTGAGTEGYFIYVDACPKPAAVLSVYTGILAFVVILVALQVMHLWLKPGDPRYLRW